MIGIYYASARLVERATDESRFICYGRVDMCESIFHSIPHSFLFTYPFVVLDSPKSTQGLGGTASTSDLE